MNTYDQPVVKPWYRLPLLFDVPEYIPVDPRVSRPSGSSEARRLLLNCQSNRSEIEPGLDVSSLGWGDAVPDAYGLRDIFDTESRELCASECALNLFIMR
jgi:hypothetical protein